MTARLPPNYYTIPSAARFRRHRLPSELWETWELIRAFSWLNGYQFTPPLSERELCEYLHVKVRALQDRFKLLRAWGWLGIQANPGRENSYVPLVPADRPESCGESASVSRHCDEESSGQAAGQGTAELAPAEVEDVPAATPAVDCGGSNNSRRRDLDLTLSSSSISSTSLRATPAVDCGGGDPTVIEVLRAVNVRTVDLDLSGMTVERAEQIAAYVRDNPDGKDAPAGWAYACLQDNPAWQPPAPRKAHRWYAEYEDLVIR